MMYYVLEPLIITVILECVFAFVLGLRTKKEIYLILLINCITNPLLVLCSAFFMELSDLQTGKLLTYVLLEPCVIIAEYLLIRRKLKTRIHPLVLSLILNLISILGGNLWRSLL